MYWLTHKEVLCRDCFMKEVRQWSKFIARPAFAIQQPSWMVLHKADSPDSLEDYIAVHRNIPVYWMQGGFEEDDDHEYTQYDIGYYDRTMNRMGHFGRAYNYYPLPRDMVIDAPPKGDAKPICELCGEEVSMGRSFNDMLLCAGCYNKLTSMLLREPCTPLPSADVLRHTIFFNSFCHRCGKVLYKGTWLDDDILCWDCLNKALKGGEPIYRDNSVPVTAKYWVHHRFTTAEDFKAKHPLKFDEYWSAGRIDSPGLHSKTVQDVVRRKFDGHYGEGMYIMFNCPDMHVLEEGNEKREQEFWNMRPTCQICGTHGGMPFIYHSDGLCADCLKKMIADGKELVVEHETLGHALYRPYRVMDWTGPGSWHYANKGDTSEYDCDMAITREVLGKEVDCAIIHHIIEDNGLRTVVWEWDGYNITYRKFWDVMLGLKRL